MKAIAELLSAVIAIINKILARQEQKQHEEKIDELQRNPGEFMSDHFNSVPNASIDHNADKASAKRDGTD